MKDSVSIEVSSSKVKEGKPQTPVKVESEIKK